MTVVARPANVDFGRIIQQTFSIAGRNPLVFGALALLLVGLPNAVFGYLWPNLGQSASNQAIFWERLGVQMLVAYITNSILQAAIIQGAVADMNGRRADLADCLRAGFGQLLPVAVIGLLLSLAIMAGFVLLIIPGIIISLAFAVAVPAQVVEHTGIIGAFRRSADLTRNHRGTIFGVNFVLGLIVLVVSVVIGGLGGVLIGAFASGKATLLTAVVVSPITTAITSIITASSVAVIYFELRRGKEGIGVENLASVFD